VEAVSVEIQKALREYVQKAEEQAEKN
jgi:hypothetical protein